MKALKQNLGIDETYTKLYRRPTALPASEQTRVKDNVFLVKGYNYMGDILHLPTDAFGYCKLLVVCDIADDSCDFEKMKDSESAPETLRAFKRMLERGVLSLPKASLTTDGGSGFKGEFHKFLYDNVIDHRVARVGRHHQLSNVDNLCRQLGEIFHGIMNAKEEQTGKQSKKWVYAIDTVRDQLNAYRQKKLPKDITTYQYPIFDPTVEPKKSVKKVKGRGLEEDIQSYPTDGVKYKMIKPKFKVGDMVNVLLQEPVNALGKKHVDKRFRMGDYRLSKKKYRVSQVLYYSGNPPYRYLIEGLPNASYTERELKRV
jgi:hypothetical protein